PRTCTSWRAACSMAIFIRRPSRGPATASPLRPSLPPMSDHELTPRSDNSPAELRGEGSAILPYGEAARAPVSDFDPAEEGGGPDLRRYVHALLRRKWWIVMAAVIGVVGAAAAWSTTEVEYTAVG